MEHDNDFTALSNEEALLNAKEARILAALMEKHLVTPKYYPLTPNALTAACNQKSSREPVMELTEGEVRHLINLLENRGLLKVDSGERTYRISHRAKTFFNLNRSEMAILTVLMLREPQTLNDILRRTSRMADFADSEEVQVVLEELLEREKPLVVLMPRGSGRREDRYFHTLCGPVSDELFASKETPEETSGDHVVEQRLFQLEERLELLESRIDELLNQIRGSSEASD